WLTVSKQSVQAIVEANAGLDLCPRSMPAADDFTGGLDGEVLKTKSMFDFRGMFGRLMLSTIALPVFLGVGFVFFDENMVFAIPFVFLIFFGSTFYFVFRLATRPARLRRYLEANGVKGSATILSVESTSVRVNRRPMINLKLKVEAPGQPPFVVEHRDVVDSHQVGRLAPNSVIPVHFDPDDPTIFALTKAHSVQ
ncbi:MAG: hypothetical protein ACPG77_16320, partial [Nannocystaceae bacterium]